MTRIRILGPSDGNVLAKVAPDVFDHAVRSEWATEFLRDPRHHIAVAIDDEVVVGFASSVHYVHPDKPPELWINEVGVSASHRRRGIARRLLDELAGHARHLGCVEAWVLTEHHNDAARALYRSVAGDEGASEAVMYSWRID